MSLTSLDLSSFTSFAVSQTICAHSLIPTMSTRVLYLISFRQSARQRAHFAIWVPYANGKDGTLIHVVGAPMAGFQLEFKRGYDPSATAQRLESFQIGQINSHHVHDWTGERSNDSTPRGNLETVASQIPPPRKSENFMAPVNEVRWM